jgi:PPM family protein phosphatase
MARTRFTVRAFTDVGLRRQRNEDAVLVAGWLCQNRNGSAVTMEFNPAPPFVCAVADGMGGHIGGELASVTALSVIAQASPSWRSAEDVSQTLIGVNEQVYAVGVQHGMQGLGTTVAGLCATADHLFVFNVGDSRVYKTAPGHLGQMSNDHSIFGADGRPTNVITKSLGQPGTVLPHVVPLLLMPGTFLMCSDGVSGLMSDQELSDAMLLDDRDETVVRIIDTVRANGAHDNFSFIIVEVEMVDSEDETEAVAASADTVIAPIVEPPTAVEQASP